jgi:chemosensory pili system protein ChpA (sensor histidine kinase/response regulator)
LSDEREAADVTAELEEMRREALADVPAVDSLFTPELDAAPAHQLEPALHVVWPHSEAVPSSQPRIASDVVALASDEGAPEPAAESTAEAPPVPPTADQAPAAEVAVPASHVDEPEPIVDFPPLAGHVTAEPHAPWVTPAQEATAPRVKAAEPTWSAPVVPAIAATPARPVASEESLLDVTDDVDPTILPIFLEEANELFPQVGEQVRGWARAPEDASSAADLRRTLHTLKGSARMAGAMRLGELAHRMESRLTINDAPVAASAELFDALDTDLDRIALVLDALRQGKSNVALPWLAAPAAVPVSGQDRAPAHAGANTTTAGASSALPATPAAPPVAGRATQPPEHDVDIAKAMLRVRADIVDLLVNEAGEVAIARARVEGELRALKANLLELTGSVIRLRSQVREIELQAETQIQSRMSQSAGQEDFDPLELDRYTRFQELTRSFAEGVNDVSTVQQSLLKNLDDADAALLAQARLSREMQQRLFAIRTVPFASLSERLYRILRKTARELDKRVNLEIHGGQTELDRSVLEKLVGPLEHLLRNALDHGVESRADRLAAGKSETGEVALTVRQIGNEIAIEITDDGRGIDFERVRERAVGLGLLKAQAEPTIHELVECLFHPGFSTASTVTQISGRGIGMDVVRNEVIALGGRVDVHTQPGKGTRFNLFLPLTLAVAQAVLVRAGGRLWAIPAPMVEQVQQIKPDVLRTLYGDAEVHWQGRSWPFHYLPRLLGDGASAPDIARYNAVLLIRSGQGTAAIHVDEMVGNQEVVVKNIGPQLARVSGISGATVLGTGEIVLIINPVQLAQRPGVIRYDAAEDERLGVARRSAAAGPPRKLVMVVDDSLTVRKFTTRLLTREGFEVITARDGVDALKLLTDHTPDAILLDIEMPRMDGFEFAKTMKSDGKSAHIPIIMITSRTADKHRNRAAELGVDSFLGKPYQEEELLRTLRGIVEVAA